MNPKAKLWLLKNPVFLLLGPSAFEHWCESCPCFTVRPLCFLLFASGSPIVFPEPPISSAPLRAHVTPATGRPRAPAALHPTGLAPRVTLSLLPPPALPSLAIPRSSTSGRRPERPPRRSVRHAGAARRSVPGRVISLSLSFSPTNRAPLQNRSNPPLPGCFAFSFSPRHRAAAAPPRRDSPQPRHPAQIPSAYRFLTSSPNPPSWSSPTLAPPSPELPPPRATPHRSRPSSTSPSTAPLRHLLGRSKYGDHVPNSPGAHARVSFSCSPALRRERRRAATAAAPPHRWSRSTIARHARSPPQCSLGPVGPARPAPPHRRPRRWRERARTERPADVEAG
jgi:hypothetical protein